MGDLKFPDQGLNPNPLHWKCKVLTTRPPGNFHQWPHFTFITSLKTLSPNTITFWRKGVRASIYGFWEDMNHKNLVLPKLKVYGLCQETSWTLCQSLTFSEVECSFLFTDGTGSLEIYLIKSLQVHVCTDKWGNWKGCWVGPIFIFIQAAGTCIVPLSFLKFT